MPALQIVARNFRGLQDTRYAVPEGVSVLVGPNGAGKSTLLGVLDLLQSAYQTDLLSALKSRGGTWCVRTLGPRESDEDRPVELGLTLDDLAYVMRLPEDFSQEVDPSLNSGERLEQSAPAGPIEVLLKRPGTRVLQLAGAVHKLKGSHLGLRVAADISEEGEGGIQPVIGALLRYRLHPRYNLHGLRKNGSQVTTEHALSRLGGNLFTVLRNWRDRRSWRPRWDFVSESMRQLFPDLFADLDFDLAGQAISARIVTPQHDETIPCYFAPSGFLVALLHLCAVASAEPGGTVALDGFENELHPFAIRHLLDAFREWASEQRLRIVLATHSPVVLNQFKREPDRVMVMDPREPRQPVALDKLFNPDWLAQFSLGDLYAHERYGAPVER